MLFSFVLLLAACERIDNKNGGQTVTVEENVEVKENAEKEQL